MLCLIRISFSVCSTSNVTGATAAALRITSPKPWILSVSVTSLDKSRFIVHFPYNFLRVLLLMLLLSTRRFNGALGVEIGMAILSHYV